MAAHLGPLGDMAEINPLKDIDTTSQRFGAVHTALSGRRTVDYIGNGAVYELAFAHLVPDDLARLEAMHHRHIRGPLRLLLGGLKRNRLSRSAASVGYGRTPPRCIEVTNGSTVPLSGWPTAAPPAGVALRWTGWAIGDGVLRFDRDHPAPVLEGETVTASVYVRAATADTVRLVLDHYTATGYSGSSVGTDVVLTADTWARITVTATPGTGVWAVSPAVQPVAVDSASTRALDVAAAQLERGGVASGWTLGGGAPVVAVDQLQTVAPYVTRSNATMTLVEL